MPVSDRSALRGKLLIFAAGCLFGTIGLFIRRLSACGAGAELTALLRLGFAFVLMLCYCLCRFGSRALLIGKQTLFVSALLGLLCHCCCNLLYTRAVLLNGLGVSAVLMNMAPAFTTAFARLFLHERADRHKLLLLLLATCGCVLVATNGSLSFSNVSALGLLLGLGAGVCYSLNAILGRMTVEKTEPAVLCTYAYFFAALFLCLFLRPWSAAVTVTAPMLVWGGLFALVPTCFAYVLYYQGISMVRESGRAAVIASVEVASAAVLGALVCRERLGPFSILGIVFVLLPAMLAMWGGRSRRDSCSHAGKLRV